MKMGRILTDLQIEEDYGVLLEQNDFESLTKNGICYVSQDNYLFKELNTAPTIVYADSATSCIIIIATGKNKNGQECLAMSHLSRPGRFQKFFKLVERQLVFDLSIYAAGANPPERIKKRDSTWDYTALKNAAQVMEWISELRKKDINAENPRLIQVTTRFGEGDPSQYKNNLDCLGIDLQNRAISNKRQELSLEDRDPTGGAQTLFCIFGDPNSIRPALPFTKRETDPLVRKARESHFEKAADMTDQQILDKYSSTPAFEVDWFCQTIRSAGEYVRDYVL